MILSQVVGFTEKRNSANQPVKFEWWLTHSQISHHPYQRLPLWQQFADL